jgi:hypothetical protein
MKKSFLLVFALLLGLSCFAQDVIVTKEGKKIYSKVTEINENDIRYKMYENLDGPSYFMKKSEIATIIYENGQVEVFNLNTIPSKTSATTLNNYHPNYLKQAKRTRNAGISLFTVGSALWITGVALWGDSFNYGCDYYYGTLYCTGDSDMWLAGICLFSIGSAITIPGIIMWAVGQTKMNRFNSHGYSLYENEKMQLNLAIGGNSVGLKLNLR